MSIVLKDGTVLPDIPSEVLAEFPYATILKCTVANQPVYLAFISNSWQFFIPPSIGITDEYGAIACINAVSGGLVSDRMAGYEKDTNTWRIFDGNDPTSNKGMWPLNLDFVLGVRVPSEVVWANHDIKEMSGVNEETGDILFSDGTYFPSSLAKPPFILPDGTELPALPAGCFDGTPYGAIVSFGTGFALCTLQSGIGVSDVGGTETAIFFPAREKRWMTDGTADWELFFDDPIETPTTQFPIGTVPVLWSNHDFLYATANADGTYTIGTEIARQSDVNYRITEGWMRSVADEARRLGDVIGDLKPDVMESALREADGSAALPDGETTTFGYIFEGGTDTIYVYAGFDNVPKEVQSQYFVIYKQGTQHRLEASTTAFRATLTDDDYKVQAIGGTQTSYLLNDDGTAWERSTGAGSAISLGSWSIVYTSHDIKKTGSTEILREAGTPEIKQEGTAAETRPIEREDEYRMTGDTLHRLCYIAQIASDSEDLMLPDEALDILDAVCGEGGSGGGNGGGSSDYPNANDGSFGYVIDDTVEYIDLYSYGGTMLSGLPQDVLDQYPYVIICFGKGSYNYFYYAFMSEAPFTQNNGLISAANAPNGVCHIYVLSANKKGQAGAVWEYDSSASYAIETQSNVTKELLWFNHDVCDYSDPDKVYYKGTQAVQQTAPGTVLNPSEVADAYIVTGSDMNALAAVTYQLTGKNGLGMSGIISALNSIAPVT